jgi:hypothetical protein
MERKPMMLAGALVAVAFVFALSSGVAGAAKHGKVGNSPAAKACQKDGYLDWVRQNGTAFANSDDCTSYAARGGTLKPKPTRTWQSVCADELGGSFSTSGSVWLCDFSSITPEALNSAATTLAPFCPGPQGLSGSVDGRGQVGCQFTTRTWQSVCADELGGSFSTSGSVWLCDFSSITPEALNSASAALAPFCPGPQGLSGGLDGRGQVGCQFTT